MKFFHRIFRRLVIHSMKGITKQPIFLNILMTDARPVSAQQKLKSFYSIIDRCLRDGRRVNVVVALGKKGGEEVKGIYSECLSDYLQTEGFNLMFVRPTTWRVGRLLVFISMVNYFAKLRATYAYRLNFACLSALARARIDFFQDIYTALPCRNWLGLTGGVELPAFKYKRDHLGEATSISALQFGQASVEQQHFSGYCVDNFFVYDSLSEQVFKKLDLQVKDMVVSGSPEFEYHSDQLCNEKLLEEDRLNVVFIDQPVQQRGEYTEEYLSACYAILKALNDDPEINLRVKLHPRGSAFEEKLSGFSVAKDWSDCLSRAHVVIGFFSNLCDSALWSGRITFFVGSTSIMDKEKRDWVVSQGGYVVDDVDFVFQEITRLKANYEQLASQITSRVNVTLESPSEIIYKRMVVCSEA